MKAALIALCAAAAVAASATFAPSPASALAKHLCGINGTVVGLQESCPGISPRHSWKRVTGYRVEASGIEMCVIVRSGNDNYLFSRCSFYATSIYIPPRDMEYGNRLTRVYNKNNNVAYPTKGERRYLYADTE